MVVGFTRSELNILISEIGAKVTEYKKNEFITRVSIDNNIGFVRSGTIYLCAENEKYERSILDFFRPGEFISGCMLIHKNEGVSYLTAKYSSEIVSFKKNELINFCISHESWRARLFDIIRGQLETKLLEHSFMLHQKTIRGKLIYYFKSERNIQGSNRFRLPVPYSDLADYLSADRAAMMREIKKMRDEGLIYGSNRSITLNTGFFDSSDL